MYPHTSAASRNDHELCALLKDLFNLGLYGHNPIIIRPHTWGNGNSCLDGAVVSMPVYAHYLRKPELSDALLPEVIGFLYQNAYDLSR